MRKSNKIILFITTFFLASCTDNTLGSSSSDSTSHNLTETTLQDKTDNSQSSTSLDTTNHSTSDNTSPTTDSSSSNNDSTSGEVINPTGKVTITINYNDGKTVNKVVSIQTGDLYGTSFAFPTRTNYVFKGWFAHLSDGKEKQITADHPVTIVYNHMVKAHWDLYSGPAAPTYDYTYTFEKPDYETGKYLTGEYQEKTYAPLYFKDCLLTKNTTSDTIEGSVGLRIDEGGYLYTYEKVDGLAQISFKHAPYKASENALVLSTLYLEYSIDLVVWTQLDSFETSNKNDKNFQSYSKTFSIGFNIYVRLRNKTTSGSSTKQVNIDLLRIMGRK